MKNIIDKFKEFKGAEVVKVSWDNGNGILDGDYVFCGLRDGEPILAHYDSVKKGEKPSFLKVAVLDMNKISINELEQNMVDSWYEGYSFGII